MYLKLAVHGYGLNKTGIIDISKADNFAALPKYILILGHATYSPW